MPVVTLIFQTGIFKFLDLVFNLESNPPSPADILGNILLFIGSIFLILIGYLIAIYIKRRSIKVSFLFMGYFFSSLLGDSKAIIHYDYLATNAIGVLLPIV